MNFVHFCVTLVNRKVVRWGVLLARPAQFTTRARGRAIDHEFPARTGKLARKWRTVNIKKFFLICIRPVWSDFLNYTELYVWFVFGGFFIKENRMIQLYAKLIENIMMITSFNILLTMQKYKQELITIKQMGL